MKRKMPLRSLIIEILVTLCIGLIVVVNSSANLESQMLQHTSELESDYTMTVDSYKVAFQLLTTMIDGKIKEDISFDEMNIWLQSMEKTFCSAIGEDIYDGIALTYKGGYARSWSYGEYSNYDASTRPWYQQAQAADGRVTVVAPYVTYLDPSYLTDDGYILMTIAQKYNDEISFDLDIKITGISRILYSRDMEYSNENIYLIDGNGYILSSSDADVYCHNVGVVDDEISQDFSDAIAQLQSGPGKMQLKIMDGVPMFMFCRTDSQNNSYAVMVSAGEVLMSNFLTVALIILALIALEIYLYRRSERTIREFDLRNARSNSILNSAYEERLFLDIDTMKYAQEMGGAHNSDYLDHYLHMLESASGYNSVQEIKEHLSPDALRQRGTDGQLQKAVISVWRRGQGDRREVRMLEITVFISPLGNQRIATILGKDITEERSDQLHVLESMAEHYYAAFLCSADANTIEPIKTGSSMEAIGDASTTFGEAVARISDMIIAPEYRQAYLEEFSLEHIRAELRHKNTVEQTVRLLNGHWATASVIRCIGFENDYRFLYCHSDADDQMSQQEKLRAALEQAQEASKAKGDFLSRMSHEIRTPLNAVIGYLTIAQMDDADHDKIVHCLENGELAAKHLLSIINDVLDMSSIESGRIKIAHEDYNLKQQLSTIATIFYNQAKSHNVTFDVKINDLTEEWVVGDQLRVNQVLMNLLSNAVKFTPENGIVRLIVEQKEIADGRVTFVFTVSDTGIGMSKEYLDKMFTPFEQEDASTARKYGGTGLGLAITRNLVTLMHGEIIAQSAQGVGTTFKVTLTFDCSAENVKVRTVTTTDYSKIHALIVDDEQSEREYAKQLLERFGVKTTVVPSGKEAVRKIRGRLNTDFAYDLCIMDWNMPDGTGIEAARMIREKCAAELPIIIVTAYDITEIEQEAKNAGVNKVIAKPLFQSTMSDLLVTMFGKYQPEIIKGTANIDLKGMRTLLAEDNPMNMEIAVDILHKFGLEVDCAENGEIARDKFTASAPGYYTCILMDIQMPVMDGYEATRQIRASQHPEAHTIPIIAMTANAFNEDAIAAKEAGMNEHISKPIDFEKLMRVLNRFTKQGE